MRRQSGTMKLGLKLKTRAGLLLMEVLVTIIIASIALLGFGYLFIETTEQMRMAWQLRDMEEFGYYYTDQFREKLRNGNSVKITRVTAPSELTVKYTDPWDPLHLEHTYTFQFDRRGRMPVIRKDGGIIEYPNFPPPSPSGRDEVFVDQSSFEIYPDDRECPPDVLPDVYDERFRPYYLNLKFVMYYRRYPAVQTRGLYEKALEFSTAAYVANDVWRDVRAQAEAEDGEN